MEPPCKAARNLFQTIIPPNHHNVNSENLKFSIKPPFSDISKPPNHHIKHIKTWAFLDKTIYKFIKR